MWLTIRSRFESHPVNRRRSLRCDDSKQSNPEVKLSKRKSNKGKGDRVAQRRRYKARQRAKEINEDIKKFKKKVADSVAPSTSLTWANTGPESKLKCLRKKLLDIETLAAKLNSGLVEEPEPELWLKVAKIPLLEKEIRALEKVIL